MKMITHVVSVAALLAVSAVTSASAREAVIVLSPVGTVGEKTAEIETVARHIIDTVSVGEQAFVIDGLTQELIAHYALPNDPERYRNPRNRMRDNATVFRDLKHFAETAIAPTENSFAGMIDFPTVLRTINASYPAAASRDLIFYNVSPVTHDLREPSLSMKSGAIPDDDHIAASRAESVYGADGERAYLQNYVVHVGANGTDWQVSDRHGHFMAKYLWLSVTKRDGTLATFATDPATALRNAKAGIAERVGPFTPEVDGHRTMVHFRPTPQAATEETGVVDEASLSIYDRTLSQRAADRSELRTAENVELAIRWDCACDFDLAVQVPGEDPVSFRAPSGASGTLFKDFTSSESLNTAWETIAMPGPVDLSALTVAVNQFSGRAGVAEVELRIAIGGETWGRMLRIAGPSDAGAGFARTMASNAAANPAWAVVDPIDATEGN